MPHAYDFILMTSTQGRYHFKDKDPEGQPDELICPKSQRSEVTEVDWHSGSLYSVSIFGGEVSADLHAQESLFFNMCISHLSL